MTTTRKARVPMPEQIKLINECRKSGIAASTFYNWISRCRKATANQILEPSYGHLETPRPKQDVVPIDVVPDSFPEHSAASQMLQHNTYLDNSHTIEVAMKDVTIRISNTADPVLLARTIQLLQEFTC